MPHCVSFYSGINGDFLSMSSDLGEFILISELEQLLEDKQLSSVRRLIN